jgi:hypothetical protein
MKHARRGESSARVRACAAAQRSSARYKIGTEWVTSTESCPTFASWRMGWPRMNWVDRCNKVQHTLIQPDKRASWCGRWERRGGRGGNQHHLLIRLEHASKKIPEIALGEELLLQPVPVWRTRQRRCGFTKLARRARGRRPRQLSTSLRVHACVLCACAAPCNVQCVNGALA